MRPQNFTIENHTISRKEHLLLIAEVSTNHDRDCDLDQSSAIVDIAADVGQFYWAKAILWAARKSIFEGKVAGTPLPRSRVQDIKTPEVWELAEVMFRKLDLG